MDEHGGPSAGVMVSEVTGSNVALLAVAAGLDFIIVDTEHGRFSPGEVASVCMQARSEGLECLVRVPTLARDAILRPLDSGAAGVMVPMIRGVDEARQAISWAKYPDVGTRGLAVGRPHTRYATGDIEATMREQNARTRVWLQVETSEALNAVEEIARLPGVDLLFLGPTDLSVNRGRPGRLWEADAVADYRRVAEAARAAGVGVAIQLGSPGDWPHVADLGMTHCSFSSDVGALVRGWTQGAAVVRGVDA